MNRVDFEKLKVVRKGLTEFFHKVCKVCCTDNLIYELMVKRGYIYQDMFDTLKEIGVFKLDYLSDITLIDPYITYEQLKDWGLINAKGDYLLKGRFTLPIKDIAGNVVALVGWYPDTRKYITTPTYGFSRDASFFNLDCYADSVKNHNGVVYLVEGIFDTISLRAIGLPAIGNMGLEMSSIKTQILKRFKKVIAIPDNDNAGRSVNPFTNKISGKGSKFIWNIENEFVFVKLPDGIKDVDELLSKYDCKDVLVACQNAKLVKKIRREDIENNE